ncbi:MAG: beta-N-acetylglucosaminidase domain-containing protein, partial [Kiritimatiellia bacterium]|nr:beta-N-acetylglucosaminidase domain-containing protein [Kiritimatiellia bacterium]
VNFKMNKIVYKHMSWPYRKDVKFWLTDKMLWRNEERVIKDTKEDIENTGKILTPLGIEWYGGMNPPSTDSEHPHYKVSASEEDIQLIVRYASMLESVGGHFLLQFDDYVLPMHPYDEERFDSLAERDIYLLNRLIAELKKKYPGAKILFCPPFYCGPDSYQTNLGDRKTMNAYFGALGQRLSKDVEIFWSGPRVKSWVVTKEHVRWITDLIQRKPVFWANGYDSTHIHYNNYLTDPVYAWKENFYEGFLKDVDSLLLNSAFLDYMSINATVSDYCWNPKAYDPEPSVREAAGKLCGPEAWPALVNLNTKLSYFDQYGDHKWFGVTPWGLKNTDEIGVKLQEVNTAWEEVLRISKATRYYSGIEWYITILKNYYSRLCKNPELQMKKFAEEAALSKEKAVQDIKLNDKTDIFLCAYDFHGGGGPKNYGSSDLQKNEKHEVRLCTWVYGKRSAAPIMSSEFTIAPYPAADDYQLIISGQDETETEKKCKIRIAVNGQQIFEGENPFAELDWTRHAFRIPKSVLKQHNEISISNIEDTARNGGPPFFMLNYAVIRKGR